jgi:hypothetical protein
MANVHLRGGDRRPSGAGNHSVDMPWWGDLVNGIDKPISTRDSSRRLKQRLLESGYFGRRQSGIKNARTIGCEAEAKEFSHE